LRINNLGAVPGKRGGKTKQVKGGELILQKWHEFDQK